MEKIKVIQKIATNLREFMNSKSLSNAEVSRKCLISTGTVSKIINGQMNITVSMLASLCEGLGISSADMLKGVIYKNTSAVKVEKNKTPPLFAGVLSVNHKRIACIKDKTGNVLGTSELGGDLDLAETIPSIYERIVKSLESALANHPYKSKNYLKSINLAVALQSYEFEDTRQKFEYHLEKYFNTVKIFSDSEIIYLTSFKNREGLSLILDKGVSLSYKKDGELKKLGGWKFPVYDLGGENWLGLTAIQHTIDCCEGYIPMSVLANEIITKFNGKIETIAETCFKSAKRKYGPTIDPDIYCLFTSILLKNYFLGDEASKKILQQGFSLIHRIVKKADSILGKYNKISLHGSLSHIYQPFFEKDRLISPPSDKKKTEILASIFDKI